MRGDLGKESKEYSYRRITKLLKFRNKRNFMHLQEEKHLKRKVNSSLGNSHHWRMPLVALLPTIFLHFPLSSGDPLIHACYGFPGLTNANVRGTRKHKRFFVHLSYSQIISDRQTFLWSFRRADVF